MISILDTLSARADAIADDFKEWLHPRGKSTAKSRGGSFTAKGKVTPSGVDVSKLLPEKASVAWVGHKITSIKGRAWAGKQVPIKGKALTDQQSGLIGENIAVAYAKSKGYKDATIVPDSVTQHIDIIQDHELVEVKTGRVHNASSHYWMTKIGQPGAAETKWLKTASKEAKARHNKAKQKKIIANKFKELREAQKATGKKFRGKMICILLNTDAKVADIHEIESFHQYVGWNSDLAKESYVGSFRYE